MESKVLSGDTFILTANQVLRSGQLLFLSSLGSVLRSTQLIHILGPRLSQLHTLLFNPLQQGWWQQSHTKISMEQELH